MTRSRLNPPSFTSRSSHRAGRVGFTDDMSFDPKKAPSPSVISPASNPHPSQNARKVGLTESIFFNAKDNELIFMGQFKIDKEVNRPSPPLSQMHSQPLFYKEAEATTLKDLGGAVQHATGSRAMSEPPQVGCRPAKWKKATLASPSGIKKRRPSAVKKVSFAQTIQNMARIEGILKTDTEVFRVRRQHRNSAKANEAYVKSKEGRWVSEWLLEAGAAGNFNHRALLAATIMNTGEYVEGRADWLKVYAAFMVLLASDKHSSERDRAWQGLWFSFPVREKFLSLHEYNELVQKHYVLPEEQVWKVMTDHAVGCIARFAIKVLRDTEKKPSMDHTGRPTILDPQRFGALKWATVRHWTSVINVLIKEQQERRGPEHGIDYPGRWANCQRAKQRLDKKIEKFCGWTEREKFETTIIRRQGERLDAANDQFEQEVAVASR